MKAVILAGKFFVVICLLLLAVWGDKIPSPFNKMLWTAVIIVMLINLVLTVNSNKKKPGINK
ncbi:hypothetical protein SAMN05192529_10493 [Arachidicoccus rhizosphaerae]|uniref:Uncharacterized protein n=1 Tax=Arachidicoccus rhizosphaerae TaxID=551991 RepID=A0A1H3WYU9_9BACT|nr:hypothetical protein SAMN05192529_10493 [Arachidicoccus rhizosphaerae]